MSQAHYSVPSREALIAELTEKRERLERWVAARTPEELEKPVTPSEVEGGGMWRPKEHLAHAVGVETYLREAAQRTVAGVKDPTEFYTQVASMDRESARQAIKKALKEVSERALAEYREAPIEGIMERLGETRQATLALLESLSDEQLNQVSPHALFGQGTVREMFQEMARHDERHVDWLTEALAQA